MMLDRLEGNEALKEEVSRMLSGRRLSHSLLLIGEQGLGAGFAARCIAADYLYPAGGPAAYYNRVSHLSSQRPCTPSRPARAC